MKTYALYADDNGNAQLCTIEHDSSVSPTDVDLKEHLPNFNEGSTLFLVETDDEGFTVTDGYGQAVEEHEVTLR